MSLEFDDARRETLRAVCDTVVPRLERTPDPHGLWGRSASDLGVHLAAEQLIAAMPADQLAGMLELLDALTAEQFAAKSRLSREQTLRNVALLGGTPAAAGIGALLNITLFLTYGMPDPATGQNPNWAAFRYPGPRSAPPQEPKTITPTEPEGAGLELEADVAVVGSGAGGGVIAGVLAERGLSVVVLEAGAYRNEADFTMLELPAYQELYWRGGPAPSADMNFTLLAGATLGGGTVVNWCNCLKTRGWVREEWARAGVDMGDFDRHIDAVWERLGVTDVCSDLNGTQRRMQQGAEALGWRSTIAYRNIDPERYDPDTGGFLGFGDQSGAKRSTLKTYLQDAFDAGARIVPQCTVERVLVEDGRAAGVQGTWTDRASGRTAQVTVRAAQVVVAAGALESPAVLLRSGIGGPATGRYLRLHPTIASTGTYGEDLQAWRGGPHALLVDEFESGEDAEGYGFRMEGSHYSPGLVGSATPWTSGEDHKALMEQFFESGVVLGRIRDHGSGQVTLDPHGQAQVTYDLTDPIDVATMHRAIDALVRLHHAAGATAISVLAQNAPTWRTGDDLDAYIARLQRVPLRFGAMTLFTAHQMGSCRMGADPATSVAGPEGELHDTPGVWIGDASAFPTASGTNPMISVMALAHRTAEAIAARAGAGAPTAVSA